MDGTFRSRSKGHSFYKQHDLQLMKTRSLSPNLSKLARAEIRCQFMKIRSLCTNCLQNKLTLIFIRILKVCTITTEHRLITRYIASFWLIWFILSCIHTCCRGCCLTHSFLNHDYVKISFDLFFLHHCHIFAFLSNFTNLKRNQN